MRSRWSATIHYITGTIAAIVLVASGRPVPAAAAAENSAASPCDTPQHHQFDFWVGDWQVFEAKSNQLVGYDRVEKHSHGCIVQQNLTMITDLYRGPGVGYRMSGIGVNRFDGKTGWNCGRTTPGGRLRCAERWMRTARWC
jgi:hypothetical protein